MDNGIGCGWMDGWIGQSVILLKDLAIRASLQILLRNEGNIKRILEKL